MERREGTRWATPDGTAVTVVPLTPGHRILAEATGTATSPEDHHAFLLTRRGGVFGRPAYALTVEQLGRLVDLAALADPS